MVCPKAFVGKIMDCNPLIGDTGEWKTVGDDQGSQMAASRLRT